MNMKKIAILALSLCMIAAIAITGTIAYFTDTEKAYNTMTVGNVDIDIDELVYDKDTQKWDKFENDKFVVYPQKEEDGSLNYNKMVQTWNNSNNNQAAYIRNFVLVEVPEGNVANDKITYLWTIDDDGLKHGSKLYKNADGQYWSANLEIGGIPYIAYAFVDKDEEATPSGHYLSTLTSVWMVETATQADAAKYGDKVDIITFSQAIQAEDLSFTEAMDALVAYPTAAQLKSWVDAAGSTSVNDHYAQYND